MSGDAPATLSQNGHCSHLRHPHPDQYLQAPQHLPTRQLPDGRQLFHDHQIVEVLPRDPSHNRQAGMNSESRCAISGLRQESKPRCALVMSGGSKFLCFYRQTPILSGCSQECY